MVGLGILIGQAQTFNCGSSSSLEASQSGDLKEKAVLHWCRCAGGAADEAVPWSSLTLLPELNFMVCV